MRITQIDPAVDEASVWTCYEIERECTEADDPAAPPWPWSTFRGFCAMGFTGEPRQMWLASDDDGEPAGWSLIELPDRDNTSNAYLGLAVRPARRRKGVGTRLFRHCVEQARLAGRKVIGGETLADPTSAGWAFATAFGGAQGLLEIRRELRVGDSLPGRLRGLGAQAALHGDGYSLVNLTGATPEPLVDKFAKIVAAIGDAPRDEGREAEVWDADRIRASDRSLALRGDRRYTVVARHDADGELAAMTSLAVSPDLPEFGFQGITAVGREHRGHRLGLAVKVAMLQFLAEREPQVTGIMTFNAADNAHMIAINEAIGFRVTGEFRSWQIDLA